MGRPTSPMYIFIARHGTRLDAADKQWHTTSPTPYDPPLTYGGFLQCKAIGARISNLLASSCNDETSPLHGRKYRVAIHSSPFLRCVQTSVAIAAGLAQNPPEMLVSKRKENDESKNTRLGGEDGIVVPKVKGAQGEWQRAVLRLDAFLGEWLTPDYYEQITPPPSSPLMLAGAKAELLKKENYSSYPHFSPHSRSVSASSGALWNGVISGSVPEDLTASPLDGMASLSRALEGIEEPPGRGYAPPTVNYAIGLSNKIPDGFVSHAKDASVVIDYQWDSTGETCDWGDGGTYGEEWTAMHKRFRTGLQKLVDYYSVTRNAADPVTKVGNGASPEGEDSDEDVETVVVVVSHGAGCNAMIGAITHQPVLMDVGIASLTMAMRKDSPRPTARSPDSARAPPGALTPLHENYDVKLKASNEHLRTSVPPSPTRSRNSSVSSITWSRNRGVSLNSYPHAAMSSFSYDFTGRMSPAASAKRRGSAASSVYNRPKTPVLSSSSLPAVGSTTSAGGSTFETGTGLWTPGGGSLSKLKLAGEDEEEVSFDDMFPDFDNKKKFPAISAPASPPQTAVEQPTVDGAVLGTALGRPSSAGFSLQQPHFEREQGANSAPFGLGISMPSSPGARDDSSQRGSILSSPIRINAGAFSPTLQEDMSSPLGFGQGGLWGLRPRPDVSANGNGNANLNLKRRWTVNERA